MEIAPPEGRIARAHVAVDLARRAVAIVADVRSIGEGRHSLEDVYLDLVGEDAEAGRR